jgi:hypothetical protein
MELSRSLTSDFLFLRSDGYPLWGESIRINLVVKALEFLIDEALELAPILLRRGSVFREEGYEQQAIRPLPDQSSLYGLQTNATKVQYRSEFNVPKIYPNPRDQCTLA